MHVHITFSGLSLDDIKSIFINKTGVKKAIFGISASTICNPKNVTMGKESNVYCMYKNVVRVTYDPRKIHCAELISIFVDACIIKQPLDPIVFYHNRPQQMTAEKLKDEYNYPYLSIKPTEMFWHYDEVMAKA